MGVQGEVKPHEVVRMHDSLASSCKELTEVASQLGGSAGELLMDEASAKVRFGSRLSLCLSLKGWAHILGLRRTSSDDGRSRELTAMLHWTVNSEPVKVCIRYCTWIGALQLLNYGSGMSGSTAGPLHRLGRCHCTSKPDTDLPQPISHDLF